MASGSNSGKKSSKRNAIRSSESGTRRTAGSSYRGRQPSSSRTYGNNHSRRRAYAAEPGENGIGRDVAVILLFAAMVFLFLADFRVLGPVGNAVSGVLFGLFGWISYILPVFVFAAVLYGIANQDAPDLPLRLGGAIGIVFIVGIFCELIAGDMDDTAGYSVVNIFTRCRDFRSGGGVLMGSAAYALYHLLKTPGTVLVLVALLVVCLVLVTQKSLSSLFGEASDLAARRRADREELQRRRREEEEAYWREHPQEEDPDEEDLDYPDAARQEEIARAHALEREEESRRRQEAAGNAAAGRKPSMVERFFRGVPDDTRLIIPGEQEQINRAADEYARNGQAPDGAGMDTDSKTPAAAFAIPIRREEAKPQAQDGTAAMGNAAKDSPGPSRGGTQDQMPVEAQPVSDSPERVTDLNESRESEGPEADRDGEPAGFEADIIPLTEDNRDVGHGREDRPSAPIPIHRESNDLHEIRIEDYADEGFDTLAGDAGVVSPYDDSDDYGGNEADYGSEDFSNLVIAQGIHGGMEADTIRQTSRILSDAAAQPIAPAAETASAKDAPAGFSEAGRTPSVQQDSDDYDQDVNAGEDSAWEQTYNPDSLPIADELYTQEEREAAGISAPEAKTPADKAPAAYAYTEPVREPVPVPGEYTAAGAAGDTAAQRPSGADTNHAPAAASDAAVTPGPVPAADPVPESAPRTAPQEEEAERIPAPAVDAAVHTGRTETGTNAVTSMERQSAQAGNTAPSADRAAAAPGTGRSTDASALASAHPAASAAAKPAGGSSRPRRYVYPPLRLLKAGAPSAESGSDEELRETAGRLQSTLQNFGINVKITDISQGPTVTRYELQPEEGVRVSKIVSLSDDIKLSLAATDIRIEAPIPGKSAIGIEVPNRVASVVALRDILITKAFQTQKSKISFGVGKDIAGQPVIGDIAKMPHVLIAGATGSGKSVCINTIIMSILFHATPEEVKLILIDPKIVELSVYNGIPHLMIPVVTDPQKAAAALQWGVAEMESRYRRFADAKVRDIKGYNAMIQAKLDAGQTEDEEGNTIRLMPRIVIIVDELADLMMVAKNDVETAICRLAQLARACGIHLVIATQRPSVNVITGLIKANMPSRIAFAVTNGVDSRTILDMNGAEKLLGKGDMLFFPQGLPKPARIQGAFVSDEEVTDVVAFLKENDPPKESPDELDKKLEGMSSRSQGQEDGGGGTDAGPDQDELFEKAGRFIIEKNNASIGLLQRGFRIGFNRAARIMDQLCEAGVVGDAEGTKKREILMDEAQFDALIRSMGTQ